MRQQVIATLGRVDELQASGQLERLLRSGARFVAQMMVLGAVDSNAALTIAVRRIGPALVFERLWTETGCWHVIETLARSRAHRFSLERAVFLTVMHRLMAGGSDLAAHRWRDDRRFLNIVGENHFAIDRDKAAEDARLDGVFVLRTNTDLNPLTVMLRYKQLTTVEQTFRTAKQMFDTRPIYHKLDETIRGHVFCSFRALVLKAESEARIAALDLESSWPALLADLDTLTETEIDQ